MTPTATAYRCPPTHSPTQSPTHTINNQFNHFHNKSSPFMLTHINHYNLAIPYLELNTVAINAIKFSTQFCQYSQEFCQTFKIKNIFVTLEATRWLLPKKTLTYLGRAQYVRGVQDLL
ncbi:uncharacterized protein BO66DRAFT_222306 [Aspergillus aculeatinus CBS 121060]|uniref:Uncharacterized protein n=1 Tax=Aspergillus aculeatinus CBS 121060 TaxID=1448322 RepID=A0ACD1HIM9_9EURO|nr:hypothetical protein BO66DRAFT_222306 [Aspergillus aculeatinus CBS 121060]RAH73436.1 hypothetical protein BO66DRAFT_222306 [Aspergillus aculeatinus CBS 121060]